MGRDDRLNPPAAVYPPPQHFRREGQTRRCRSRDRSPVVELAGEAPERDAGIRVRRQSLALERSDTRKPSRQGSGSEQVLLTAGGQPDIRCRRESLAVFVEQGV